MKLKEKVRSEWGKISWPGKGTIYSQVIAVVGITAIMAVLITAFDMCGQWIVVAATVL